MADTTSDADRVTRRMGALESARQPWESEWRDCADLTYPERGYGFGGSFPTNAGNPGATAQAEIFDDTAKDGCRVMASAFVAGMVPANSKWLDLDVGEATDEETRWLSDASQFLFDNIHGSNFDAVAFEGCLDLVSVSGAFVLYVGEAPEGGFHFETWPVGQCYFAASKAGGPVDTVYRRYTLTVEQCVNEYGHAKVSDTTRDRYDAGKFDDVVEIVWAIEPRAVRQVAGSGAALARNMPWASVHMELSQKHVCRVSGYEEFPCVVPRWMLIPGSHYAKAPMSGARATAKTLNEIQRLELVNLEMSAYGMFKATDDGVLNPFTTKIGPRRIVVVADMKNFDRIEPAGDFKLSFAKKDELQRQVRKLLLADQLTPQDGPAMTATEVHARIMLIRQQLGPAFGRFIFEWLTKMVFRCFGIAFRAGELERSCGPIPQTLRDRILNVKYSSPLARAQKLEEVSAADQWLQAIVAVATETQDPTQLDIVDMDELQRFKSRALGVPAKIVRTKDAIALRQQQRAAAQQQAQQMSTQQTIQAAAGQEAAKNLVANAA